MFFLQLYREPKNHATFHIQSDIAIILGRNTVCPRSSDSFYLVTYYIKWFTTVPWYLPSLLLGGSLLVENGFLCNTEILLSKFFCCWKIPLRRGVFKYMVKRKGIPARKVKTIIWSFQGNCLHRVKWYFVIWFDNFQLFFHWHIMCLSSDHGLKSPCTHVNMYRNLSKPGQF